MKVIIKKTSKVENVSFGYAVNYLIPRDLAVRATPKNLKELESKKIFQEKKVKEKKKKDKKLTSNLKTKKITIKVKSSKRKKAFGSVGKKQILNALRLTKSQADVLLDKPIKKIGKHKGELKIGNEKTKIEVELVRE